MILRLWTAVWPFLIAAAISWCVLGFRSEITSVMQGGIPPWWLFPDVYLPFDYEAEMEEGNFDPNAEAEWSEDDREAERLFQMDAIWSEEERHVDVVARLSKALADITSAYTGNEESAARLFDLIADEIAVRMALIEIARVRTTEDA